MDGTQEKPFDAVSIVILMLLAVANDAAEIFFDLLALTGIGLAGQAIMKPIDLAMDGLVTFWFFSKVGFGGPLILQFVDDILQIFFIPGRTICVGLGIFMANNPKLAQVTQLAVAIETGGAAGLGELAEAGEATGGAAAAGARATTATIETSEIGAGGSGMVSGTGETMDMTRNTEGTWERAESAETRTREVDQDFHQRTAGGPADAGTSSSYAQGEEVEPGSKGGRSAQEIDPEMLGERKETMEGLREELLEKSPEGKAPKEPEGSERGNETTRRLRKRFEDMQKQQDRMRDIRDVAGPTKKEDDLSRKEEGEDELQKTA